MTQIKNVKDYYLRELSIRSFNGATYDISLMRNNLYIFEDIFSPFLTAQLELVDTLDLPTLLPFCNEESVTIIFTKQDVEKEGYLNDIKLELFVYKITDKTIFNNKTQGYTLHLISKEAINSNKKKIYKSFKHEKYSNIVESIYNDVKDKRNIEIQETQFEYNHLIQNKSTFNAITNLSTKSIPTPFVFFEDRDGYKFINFDSLITQESKETYVRRIANTSDTERNLSKSIDKDFRRIEFLEYIDNKNAIDRLLTGFYGKELVTINPLLRSINKTTYKPSTDFQPKLDKNKTFRTENELVDTISNRIISHTNQGINALNKDERESNVEQYLLNYFSRFTQVFSSMIKISIPGDPRRKVGDVVTLELPEEVANIDKNTNEKPNRYNFGKWVITELVHHISYQTYTINMTLCKDSFKSSIIHEDIKELSDKIY